MSNQYGIGAPKGGRVHWVLWELSGKFKNAYHLEYNYTYHRYVFYRLNGRSLHDIFIVSRTSKKYFRGVYVNVTNQRYDFFGAYSPADIARKIENIYFEEKEKEK